MVFPTFFNLSLSLAIGNSWSEPQSTPGLVFADCIELSIFGCKEYNQSDFNVDHLVMSICRVFSCVVGKGCLLWPVCSLGTTLWAFALLHSVLQGQIYLLFQVFLDFLLLHSSSLWWKGHLQMLVPEGLVGPHRTIQLQLLQHYWSGHRLGLLWCWIVCLENEQRSFCCFWDCTQVLHFGLFVEYDGYSISYKGFLPTVVDIMVIWVKFTHSSTF